MNSIGFFSCRRLSYGTAGLVIGVMAGVGFTSNMSVSIPIKMALMALSNLTGCLLGQGIGAALDLGQFNLENAENREREQTRSLLSV